tara:strand:+ start:465 stop:707 length:243 start_codon:yes stop_codon:yes gene_type:complete
MDYVNTIVRKRKFSFNEWQERNMKDLGGEITHNKNSVKNVEYLIYFYNEIKRLVISDGYSITNEKEFRNKIGTLLYKISE